MAVLSYNSAQKKSRDSKRKQDLAAIQKALELAKQDSAGQAYYPNCDATATFDGDWCLLQNDSTESTNPDLFPAYIKSLPYDPTRGTSSWLYTGYDYYPSNCSANGCTRYQLKACAENYKDPQAVVTVCGGGGEPPYAFIVSGGY